MSAEPVLVFGATGSQGGAVARELLSRAVPVRALVRDSASERARALSDLGAELVVGDLTDEWSLAQAFSTVPVAYAITTPFENGADAEVRQGDTIIRAAAQAGLPWLILASVAAADRAPVPHFRSKARIEAQLGAGSVPWTVVAPSYFYENVLGASLAEGVLPLPLPVHTPLDQVALRDLGALVAAILDRRDEHLSARIEVAADAPTPEQMATALGVRAVQTSISELAPRNPDLAAMYTFLAQTGYGIDIPALRARYPEVSWSRFADWAADLQHKAEPDEGN
ncbi:MAG: NmrA family NAD(P)-binding protein [Solirubrobacteraceae bacterium]